MKFSAPKLLILAARGDHMPNCPHKNRGKGTACICWNTAVQNWSAHRRIQSTSRVRKNKPQKTHSDHFHCGSKNVLITTSDDSKVNCGHCKKLIANPPRRRRAKNSLAHQTVAGTN